MLSCRSRADRVCLCTRLELIHCRVFWARATAVGTFLLGFPASYCPGQRPLSGRRRAGDGTGTDTPKAQFNTIRGGWPGMGAMPRHLRQGLKQPWSKLPLASPAPPLFFFFHFLFFISFLLPVSLFNSLTVCCCSNP